MFAVARPILVSMLFGLQAMSKILGVDSVALGPSECITSESVEVLLKRNTECDDMSFLQADFKASSALARQRQDQNRFDDPSAIARAQDLRPIAWVHVPKSGSSFLNTLYHNRMLCPDLPSDAWLAGDSEVFLPVPTYLEDYPPEVYCPGGWSATYTTLDSRNHESIGDRYAANAGHFVTMLRQPEQRIISHYNYQLGMPGWMGGYDPGTLKTFAETFQGCTVKMLARSESLPYCFFESPSPTVAEDDLAVQRLRTGFAFVGITDEWELSICLFHAIFGGDCKVEELGDMRIGPNRSSSDDLYNTSALEGFTDMHDGRLYSEALMSFETSLQRYGVTRMTCSSSCT